jgi:hypothetical protein
VSSLVQSSPLCLPAAVFPYSLKLLSKLFLLLSISALQVILVGGFASSPYLRQRVKTAALTLRLAESMMVPPLASAAVMIGKWAAQPAGTGTCGDPHLHCDALLCVAQAPQFMAAARTSSMRAAAA